MLELTSPPHELGAVLGSRKKRLPATLLTPVSLNSAGPARGLNPITGFGGRVKGMRAIATRVHHCPSGPSYSGLFSCWIKGWTFMCGEGPRPH